MAENMADENKQDETADKPVKAAKATKAEKSAKTEKAPKAEKDEKAPKAEKKEKTPKKAEKTEEAAVPVEASGAVPAPATAGEGPAPVTAASVLAGDAAPVKKQKVRGAKHIPFGIVHVLASFNNTIVSISDMKGAVIAWSSSGRGGFKGSRKSTAFAATVAAQEAARQASAHGLQEVEIRVQGPGAGRESAIRAIMASGININAIKDITPMPHNGCRARKRRRV
jgi:small subunit ribosomal protein S11